MFKPFLFAAIFLIFSTNKEADAHPSSDNLADLVSGLSPSVVYVFTVQKPKKQNEMQQLPFDNSASIQRFF